MTGRRCNQGADEVTHNGVTYRRYPASANMSQARYFLATTAPREYLHRVLYAESGRAVPDGWHIHHIDGDYNNNALSNLAAVPPDEHARIHSLHQRIVAATCRGCGSSFNAKLERARWCSAACKERTRRLLGTAYVRPRKPAEVRALSCVNCSSAFASSKPWAKFCGQACRNHFNNASRRAA